jgi:hypothetical protein
VLVRAMRSAWLLYDSAGVASARCAARAALTLVSHADNMCVHALARRSRDVCVAAIVSALTTADADESASEVATAASECRMCGKDIPLRALVKHYESCSLKARVSASLGCVHVVTHSAARSISA